MIWVLYLITWNDWTDIHVQISQSHAQSKSHSECAHAGARFLYDQDSAVMPGAWGIYTPRFMSVGGKHAADTTRARCVRRCLGCPRRT